MSYPSSIKQKKGNWVRGQSLLEDSTQCNRINNIGGDLAYFIIKGNKREHFVFFLIV